MTDKEKSHVEDIRHSIIDMYSGSGDHEKSASYQLIQIIDKLDGELCYSRDVIARYEEVINRAYGVLINSDKHSYIDKIEGKWYWVNNAADGGPYDTFLDAYEEMRDAKQ